jgi:glycosyltransferase involved in cell wall biosynthesis
VDLEGAVVSEKLTFACVTQNRIDNLKRNLPAVLPYFDEVVIVDGGSSDGTEDYVKSLGDKITYVYRKWDDSFANQYNEYLRHISEGWVLICDDDELPSTELLKCLRTVMEESEGGRLYASVEFRCHPQDREAGWDPGPSNHHRQIFYKYNPNLRYTVNLHQSLTGIAGRQIRRSETYFHIKTRQQEFRNACRNYYIGGCWPSSPVQDGIKEEDWQELQAVVSTHYPEVEVFSDLDNIMIQGNIKPEFRAWILKYKDKEGGLYNELRAYNVYYFEILHPEEL